MCGISGIINLNGSVQDIPVHIRNMTDALRHRGPDGEGFLFLSGSEIISAYGSDTPESVRSAATSYAPKVSVETVSSGNIQFALGHRRLSIIDVSPAGHQPMCDPEKKIWIIYNGEIYNYLELREELKSKGIVFRTNTDTEVVLQAYRHWGEECVSRFNGMWAFGIYDSEKNILFGSRDRVGIKPFYYYRNASVFAFASEQKALLKFPQVKTGINYTAAADFLAGDVYFTEKGEENMFKGIFELMPAHNFKLELSTGAFQKRTYYSLKANTSFSAFNETKFERYRDETEKLLIDSVKLRLRSDVPVGSCLSGGIDSSAIVGIMAKLAGAENKINLGGKLKVFTLAFDDPAVDESKWAKQVVDRTGAEWHRVSPTAGELIKDLQDMNYAQDIPVYSTGTYGQFQLMRKAKEQGIKVILDGQGGDELFGGYEPHALVLRRELFRRGLLGQYFLEASADGKMFYNLQQSGRDIVKRKFAGLLPLPIQEFFYRARFSQNSFLKRDVVHEYVYSEGILSGTAVTASSTLNEALLRDFMNSRLKMYLKYEDRSSMWHSVEARTPFADDHRLVEYVFNVPGSYKIHRGISKYLLREAARNFLPAEIKNRRDKMGFITPIDAWVRQLRGPFLDLLDDSTSDFLEVKKIKQDPDKFFTMRNHADAVRVFRMISFAVWKKRFNL